MTTIHESLVDAQEEINNDNDVLRPTLWGIDEDDGQLFAMGDYTDSSTMIDYGLLKWNDNGVIKNIGNDMEAMTIDENGDMYIALDRKLSGTGRGATLLKTNVTHVTPDGNNVVEVLGTIGVGFNHRNDNISGLSINPINGELVALLKNYNRDGNQVNDRLYVIDKTDGSKIREIGQIKGSRNQSKRAEDIEHAPDGSLYVTDDHDDHTYKVNTNTGAIVEVTDNNQKDGLGSTSVKFEAFGLGLC